MKKMIFFELRRLLREKPHLKRKLKMAALVAVIGVVLSGVLLVWAAVTAVGYVTQSAQNVNVVESLEGARSELEAGLGALPALAPVGCWNEVQSLLNIGVWIEVPVANNLQKIERACFGGGKPVKATEP